MATVVLQSVCKDLGTVRAVEDLSLEVGDGEFMVLLGPSGCGKTTTLRMVAGLEPVSSGRILIDGRLANDLHPSERDVAMVFQSYALYPHMSVRRNLGYALARRGVDKREVQARVEDTASTLGLSSLLERKPGQLSGGQRQRVALGRAVIRKPKLFLMDEPLSNLDAKLRVEMRSELIRLQSSLGITTIYVTHDQVEGMTMGQRVAIMRAGRLEQLGKPLELFRQPCNRFVAEFMGQPSMNFFRGALCREGSGSRFTGQGLSVFLPGSDHTGEVEIGVRPQHLKATSRVSGSPTTQCLGRGTVDFVEHLGTESFANLTVGGRPTVATIDPEDPLDGGTAVALMAASVHFHVFEVPNGTRVQQGASQQLPPTLIKEPR